MKELVGLFMLLYTLGQVAMDRERPEVLLKQLDRYSKDKPVCASEARLNSMQSREDARAITL